MGARKTLTLCFFFVLTASTATAQQALRYEIASAHPGSHLMEVRLEVPAEYGCPDVAFSTWTPGGYVENRHARRVVEARFASSVGEDLAATKTDLDTWRVSCDGSQGFRALFRIYVHSPKNPYSAHVGDRLLFANTVVVLPYLPGHQNAPARLTLSPPEGWSPVCSLPASADDPRAYIAPSWDVLADAVFAAAPDLRRLTPEVEGTDLEITFTEPPSEDVDLEEIADAHIRLAQAAAKTFGGLPFERYLFLYKVGPEGSRGGLEHAESTAMGIPRTSVESTEGVLEHMGLASHELVHAWNVKRARPRPLTPYDYRQAHLTELLWVAEGWTSYYGPLLLTRAGVRSPHELYETLAERINRHRANPGNRFMSLADFSRDTWLRWPVPFFTFRTYYIKGSLAALDLDLRIRISSDDRYNLDDLMQTLLEDAELRHRGYTRADLIFHANRLSGASMEAWFRRTIDTPGYAELEESLRHVGLRLEPDPDSAPISSSGLGFDNDDEGLGLLVKWSEPDSPAARSNLGEGDRILAVDGHKGSVQEMRDALDQVTPGQPVQLTVERDHRVFEVTLVPARLDPRRIPIRVVEDLDAGLAKQRTREAWLGRN